MENSNRQFQKGFLAGVCGALALAVLIGAAAALFLLPSRLARTEAETAGEEAEGSLEEKLREIQTYIDAYDIFDVDPEALEDSLLAGYVSGLGDPYSVYYTQEELDSVLESTSGAYYGIGVLVGQMTDGSLQVIRVFQNSPAMEAGMEQADVIVGVDGRNVEGMELDQMVALIQGAEGSQVTVTVYR